MLPRFIISEFFIKRFFLLLILFLTTNYSFAQIDDSNYLGVSFGGSDFHIKDDRASPLIFSSIGIAPSLQYIYKGEINRHYAEVSYYYNYLSTSSDNFHDDNHRGRIRYSYLHSITEFGIFDKQISFFLGGSATTFLSHSDYNYLWVNSSEARSMESWYWSNSVDLSAQLEYNPTPREFLSIQLFLPVLSNVSRPEYSPSGDYNYEDNDWKFKMFGDTKFFPKNFSINTLITYQRQLDGNFNVQFSYEFYYSFYNEPRVVKMYMNNLRAGLFFCF